MLQAFWDFLTNNKDPIDTLLKILTFLGLPIGALITALASIIRRWWRSRLRLEINAFDFILDSDTLLARVYNEENNISPLAHHQIEYQSRDPNRDIQTEFHRILKTSSRYLLIEGRTGLGKTREAATLAKSFMNEGYRVIRVTTAWLDMPKEFPKELNNDRRRILFLLDDLNGLFRSGDFIQSPKADQILAPSHDSYHDRLLRMLDAFEQICGKDEILVIATARNEANEWNILKFDSRDALWSRFHRVELSEPIDDSLMKLIDNFAAKVNLQIERPDLSLVVNENDGTFMNVVLNLQRLKRESKILSLENYTATLDGSWREVYERALHVQPAIRYIYDSIDLLRQTHINLYIWTIEPVASLLWGGNVFQQFFRRYKINHALRYLLYEEKILAQDNAEIAPRDGQIEAKGTQVDWKPLALTIHRLIIKLSEQKPEESIKSLSGFSSALFSKGFIEEALSLMRKRTELSPRNPQLWIDLDGILEALKRYEEAEQALQKAVACQPDDEHPYFHLGLLLSKTKRFQEAEEAYRKAITLKPGYHYLYINLGIILENLKRNIEAEEVYHKAIALKPEDDVAYFNLGNLLRKSERFPEAEMYLAKAIALDDKDGSAWAMRGEIFLEMERYEEALTDLDRAIELDKKQASALANRAQIYLHFDKLDEALTDINLALTLDDKNAPMFSIRGKIFRELGMYDKSIEDLNKVIILGGQKGIFYAERGDTYLKLDEYDEALSDFDLAIKLDQNYHWAYERRGVVLRNLGRLVDALDSFTQAKKTDPTCSVCIVERGETYQAIGKYDQALADFNEAIDVDHNNYTAFFKRGFFHFAMGKYELALVDFENVIKIQNQHHLAYHEKCVVLRILKRFEDAVESIIQIINIDSGCHACFAELGETFRRMGAYQQALENFERAMELSEENDDYARSRRAAVYNALGDTIARDVDISHFMEMPLEVAADFYNKAVVLVLKNQQTDALDLLESAIEKDASARVYAQNDDLLDPLRKHPKFQELIRLP